jgi:hypothetical protein
MEGKTRPEAMLGRRFIFICRSAAKRVLRRMVLASGIDPDTLRLWANEIDEASGRVRIRDNVEILTRHLERARRARGVR